MGKIVPERNINNYKTYLWTQGEAEGIVYMPKGRFSHVIHNFITRQDSAPRSGQTLLLISFMFQRFGYPLRLILQRGLNRADDSDLI